MADYISREAVFDVLFGRYCASCDETEQALTAAIEEIKTIPAVDVAPVRHGRWFKAQGSWCTPGGDPVWECDQCGKGRHVYGIEHGTYGRDIADGQWVSCPNCGADMREDV